VYADLPVPQRDVAVLVAEVTAFLEQGQLAEGIAAKLNRLLLGFLQAEVLPPATRAADLGIDPTPLFAVVTTVLRMYADALEPPDAAAN
jgi:hypothetical protein